MRQIAALPYRIEADGSARILLITSRETRRWVIPKGNPIPGLPAHEAAAREAFEEAGISGVARSTPIGTFGYDKRRADGTVRRATVAVFPLTVTAQSDDFPERGQREQRWFSPAEAADAVDEPELKRILGGFRMPLALDHQPGWFARLRRYWF